QSSARGQPIKGICAQQPGAIGVPLDTSAVTPSFPALAPAQLLGAGRAVLPFPRSDEGRAAKENPAQAMNDGTRTPEETCCCLVGFSNAEVETEPGARQKENLSQARKFVVSGRDGAGRRQEAREQEDKQKSRAGCRSPGAAQGGNAKSGGQ